MHLNSFFLALLQGNLVVNAPKFIFWLPFQEDQETRNDGEDGHDIVKYEEA
jgi:hypothetical protein